MNTIYNVVSMDEFKRISNVEVAHTAWNIFQTMHEGTKAVKINKLQQLTTRFESIRMFDDECFDEFYAKLNDIVNSTYNFGEIYDQPKIVRMKAFLKSIDERIWNSVDYGWEKPTTPVSEWQTSEKEAAPFNSKTMNTIYNIVSIVEFKRISNVEVAHTAWNILQNVHEGTKTVKINKLQQLTTRFESIRMSDDECFDKFYAKLNNIVNSAYNFGEIYDQPKIVRKIHRSLTEDLRPKMTAITESKDVNSIPVDELVGSLQSYELDLPKTNKSKSMALKSIDDVNVNGFDDELSTTEIAYLAKNFRNFLKNNN